MNRGDIVFYQHSDHSSFYGIVTGPVDEDVRRPMVYVTLRTPGGFKDWCEYFPCKVDKLTMLEEWE